MSTSIRRDREIIQYLYRLAYDHETTLNNGAKICAAVQIKNQLISIGFNQGKTHPLQARFGRNADSIFLHAEISAIKNALNHIHADDLIGATLFVARAKRNKARDWGLAKPCEGCTEAINFFGISTVNYTTDNRNEFMQWKVHKKPERNRERLIADIIHPWTTWQKAIR